MDSFSINQIYYHFWTSHKWEDKSEDQVKKAQETDSQPAGGG